MTIRAESQIDLTRVDDGAPGVSPTATVTKVGDTAIITITDSDGTTTASVMDGTDGTNGISVSSVEPQYYLSTSDSSTTGGSWSSTPPAFVSGYYYWTRDFITFSDGSTDTSTEVYNAGLTQAAQDALDANTTASETAQYFWFKSTGGDNGAHITEVDRDTFENTPAGGNVLANSNGVTVREALKELAKMSANGFEAITYDSNNDPVTIALLGYGPGNDDHGGTTKAPYYDLGVRAAGTPGIFSIIEGYTLEASGAYSHAEGRDNQATGDGSHAEGNLTKATGDGSHAENTGTEASGQSSHAEGENTKATATAAHAQNYHTIAAFQHQTAIGKYNQNSNRALEIGNGTADNARSNALTVDWSGNIDAAGYYATGGAKIGSYMKKTGSNRAVQNTYQQVNLGTVADSAGNVFDGSGINSIKCLYAGIVHITASVRFNDGFTANDYLMARLYNSTQSAVIQTGRIRTPTQVFNGDVIVDAYAKVNANDEIILQVENATGSRGNVTGSETSVTACYIAPAL